MESIEIRNPLAENNLRLYTDLSVWQDVAVSSYGRRLQDMRAAKFGSVTQAAKAAGIDPETLRAYERDEPRRMQPRTRKKFHRLADLLEQPAELVLPPEHLTNPRTFRPDFEQMSADDTVPPHSLVVDSAVRESEAALLRTLLSHHRAYATMVTFAGVLRLYPDHIADVCAAVTRVLDQIERDGVPSPKARRHSGGGR